MLSIEEMKKSSAKYAVNKYVKDNMIIGLGTGTTVYYAILELSKLVSQGYKLKFVPTSKDTEKLAKKHNLPLTTLNEFPKLDLTIDGADEIDKNLNMVKGGKGALLREKILAKCSKKVVIIVDETKLSSKLCEKAYLPVEVLPFGYKPCLLKLKNFQNVVDAKLRMKNSEPFTTDNGNFIIDCKCHPLENPEKLEEKINMIPGILENGLFVRLADIVVVTKRNGTIKELERN